MFTDARGDWPELVGRAAHTSTYATELSALSREELPALVAYLSGAPRLAFRYVSVHAPTKRVGGQAQAVVDELLALPAWVRAVVTHPDVIDDAAPYRELGARIVLENMDDRKPVGRTVEELEAAFVRLPDAGFCLDVAHAWSVDPTLGLAHSLLDRFRSRLRHVHLSSLDGGAHTTLTEAHEALFEDVLSRCKDVPWILEAQVPARWRSAVSGVFAASAAASGSAVPPAAASGPAATSAAPSATAADLRG